MTGYTRKVTQTVPFDGRDVSFTHRRMTRPELMGLQQFFSVDPESGKGSLRVELQDQFVAELSAILPNVITALSGVEMDGEVLHYVRDTATEDQRDQFREVLEGAYFMQLQMDMALRIMASSSPPVDPATVKKSKGTPKL